MRGGSFIRQKDGSLIPSDPAQAAAGRLNFDQAVDELLSEERFSASAVFDRIKEVLGCESDVALAWIFGTSPQHISNRKKRNSVPYREAVFISLWADASLEYLLTGERKVTED